MSTFKTLLLHEIIQQIKTLKFILLVVVSVVLSIVIGYLNINNYVDRHENYLEEVRKAEDAKHEFRVYSEFNVPIFNPPNPLSIFAKGFDEKADYRYDIAIAKLPIPQSISVGNNPLMVIFNDMDIVQMIAVIFSLWILFITVDAIVSEKENSTLKIIFANRVNRLEFFFAKYIGALIPLSLALLLSFILVLILVVLNSSFQTEALFFVKVFILFLYSIVFLSFFILLGLMISTLSKSSAGAVAFSLFTWLVITFLYPNTISYLIDSQTDIQSEDVLMKKIEEDEKQLIIDAVKWESANSPKEGTNFWSSRGGGFERPYFPGYILGSRSTMEFYLKYLAEITPRYLESQNRTIEKHISYENMKLRQAELLKKFTFYLPNYLFISGCELIATTDRKNEFDNFWTEVRMFRSTVMEYLKNKNAFGYRFFTVLPVSEFRDETPYIDNIESFEYENTKTRIPIDDSPVFVYHNKIGTPVQLIVLILCNIALFIFGVNIFRKQSLII